MRHAHSSTASILALCLGLAGCAGEANPAAGADASPAGDGGAVPDAAENADAAPPSCTDRVRNGDETGIDCGGLCPACEEVEAADFYVAPDGDDSAPGTLEAPFATWEKLGSVMQPGDLAYIRGGTYRTPKGGDAYAHVHWQGLAGTAENPIRIWAYPGERPVLDLDNVVTTVSANGVVLEGSSHVWLRGLRITGLAQQDDGTTAAGLGVLNNSHDNIIERCEVDNVGGYGFYVGQQSNDNSFVNCDAHHLADPHNPGYPYGGANGFMQTGNTGSRGTLFSGCRAWWISDDGFDLYGEDGDVTIENSWSFWNGYIPGGFEPAGDGMGFKLGPTSTGQPETRLRIIRGNIAAANRAFGFDDNGAECVGVFHNNTAYDNAKGWFWGTFPAIAHEFRNNLAYANTEDVYGMSEAWINDHNSWNDGLVVTDGDFDGLDVSLLAGPRGPGGELPDVPTLRPKANSPLVDSGVDVGRPFSGAAPDRGAREAPSL